VLEVAPARLAATVASLEVATHRPRAARAHRIELWQAGRQRSACFTAAAMG
jgi:hypothetical protein